MTNEQRLDKLSIMLDDNTVSNNIKTVYLEIANRAVLNKVYPFDNTKTTVPAKYEYIILEIACYLINKRGAEGQLSHKENGIDRTYESSSIPPSMLNDIVPYVGVL